MFKLGTCQEVTSVSFAWPLRFWEPASFFWTSQRQVSGQRTCTSTQLCCNRLVLIGMDPMTRRLTWEAILERKKQACILMCTHHLVSPPTMRQPQHPTDGATLAVIG